MFALALVIALTLPPAPPQDQGGFPGTGVGNQPRVEIPWNRYYDVDEIYGLLDQLAAEWPKLLSHEVIGHSFEGREIRVYTLNDPNSGPAASKPAMWIDANVHGNEVQGSEVIVYTAWYLLENRGHLERVDALFENGAFYLLPIVNPDGRHHWIHDGHSGSSSRTGYKPLDNDRDGRFDEDGYDDLDGDGHIVSMRKYVPGQGTHRLDPDDPRIMVPVPENSEGIRGDWLLVGREGIDNDGDGRINEDGEGGYDMNRAWPSVWRPDHVQGGAGPIPLYWPETRCIAEFMLAHPEIAGVQSFHNSGGMILRGPGTESFGEYPRRDLRVYDELGAGGEKMLPFYGYMILWDDLYTVFGGFCTWAYEGMGIISFTNELWASSRLFPDKPPRASVDWNDPEARRRARDARNLERTWFDDNLLLGGGFIDWHPYDHPLYGEVEIGGFRKDVGRVPPTFLIEEMLHRNALFCISHATAMPKVVIDSVEALELGGELKAVDVVFRNLHLIPTRTARAAEKGIGTPDRFTLTGPGIEVLAGGVRGDRWRPEEIELALHEPARLVRESGIDGRGEVHVRWIVRGSGEVTVGWNGQKARDVRKTIAVP